MTIDELLSGEEVLILAEENRKQNTREFRDLVFGLLDLSNVMLLFLPFFRQQRDGTIQAVSLLALSEAAGYLKALYFAVVVSMILWGLLTLTLQNTPWAAWNQNKVKLSLLLHTLGTLLLIISAQPYAAAFGFLLLGIKVVFLIKKP